MINPLKNTLGSTMNYPFSRELRYFALAALYAVLVSCGGGSAGSPAVDADDAFYPSEDEEWELVWQDEFDGDTLNAANWEPQIGDGSDYGLDRWGNAEQQWYLAENASVADGLLTITARSEEVVPGFPYTSARLRSANKFDFQYGRVEVRAKAAMGGGLWSAIWMLPTDSPYGVWAGSGEFDIMEVVNAGTQRERVFLTAHHGFEWPLNQQAGMDVEVDAPGEEFHTYAIEWSDNLIHWFIDDVHYMTVGAEHYYSYYYAGLNEGYKNGGESAPFDVPFHLLINLAVGGNLPGSVNNADIPSDMVVDYVRVYRCTYDNEGGRGCNSNVDRLLERPGAQEAFVDAFPLYTDSAESLSWLIAGEPLVRELAVNSFWDNDGSLAWMETEVDGRGSVIEVSTSNMGNISISATDGDVVELFGFGNSPNWWEKHAGELKFDMYIDSAGTDLESEILIKMDSGYPALGTMPLAVSEMPHDQWFSVSVPVSELIKNAGSLPLNTSEIVSLFVLEPTSSAHVMVDNIELVCGHPAKNGCGIRPPGGEVDSVLVPVFTDGEIAPIWDRGACAYDTTVGGDYCEPDTLNLITWSVSDSGDPDIGMAMNVNFGTNGADGVFFFAASAGVDLSSFVGNGKLKFDLRLPADTAEAGMVFKVDCFYPCGTGDQPIDLTDYEPGTWKTFEYDVASLIGMGLNVGNVNAGLVLFPTWGDQQGYSFEVANVRYEADSADGGSDGGGSGGNPDAPPYAVLKNGEVAAAWEDGISAFDEGIGYASCIDDGGEECPNISWSFVEDDERGSVLQVEHGSGFAGLFFGSTETRDLSDYIDGVLSFDIKVVSEGINTAGFVMKADCIYPCSSGDQAIGTVGLNGWETVEFSVLDLVLGGLNLEKVNTGLVIFPVAGQTDGVAYRLDNIEWKVPPKPGDSPLVGSWRIAPEAGALKVGPGEFDGSWWQLGEADVDTRACLMDDLYVFNADGTFQNVPGDETWLEGWQGVSEGCGAPVEPHDGSVPATWSYDAEAKQVTLEGVGAYLGLAKVYNGGELAAPYEAVASITYNVTEEDDGAITLSIPIADPGWWTFKMVKD